MRMMCYLFTNLNKTPLGDNMKQEIKEDIERIEQDRRRCEERDFKGFTKLERFVFKVEDNSIIFLWGMVPLMFLVVPICLLVSMIMGFLLLAIYVIPSFFVNIYYSQHKLFERHMENQGL